MLKWLPPACLGGHGDKARTVCTNVITNACRDREFVAGPLTKCIPTATPGKEVTVFSAKWPSFMCPSPS